MVNEGLSRMKHVWQYYYEYDYLNNKCKSIYYGPKLDWMKEFKNGRKRKVKKIQANTKQH